MIEILPSPAHVAAFHFTGTLSGEDYDRCVAVVEGKLAEHRRIAIFSDLDGLDSVSASAMGKDVRYALFKLGDYHRFARGAVVTDRGWLARTTAFAGMFFPQTQLRTFAPDEREVALAWVGDFDPDA